MDLASCLNNQALIKKGEREMVIRIVGGFLFAVSIFAMVAAFTEFVPGYVVTGKDIGYVSFLILNAIAGGLMILHL